MGFCQPPPHGLQFIVGDAGIPALRRHSYDVVLSRHVLWAMPDPARAFARWIDLLGPGGTVVLIEGRWGTGAGLSALECEQLVGTVRHEVEVRRLADRVYWGKDIGDERYLVLSRR